MSRPRVACPADLPGAPAGPPATGLDLLRSSLAPHSARQHSRDHFIWRAAPSPGPCLPEGSYLTQGVRAPALRGAGARLERADAFLRLYGMIAMRRAFERLYPLPHGPPGSRYQPWKYQVLPADRPAVEITVVVLMTPPGLAIPPGSRINP